jgi:hypothetical protein
MNLRDYGFINLEVVGVPRCRPLASSSEVEECPNCHCKTLMQCEVDVKDQRLRGGKGVGHYIGCPACPWASPMIAVSAEAEEEHRARCH